MGVIAFIESNTTGTGELFVRAALRRGLRPYFLTSDAGRYPFLADLPVVMISIDTGSTDRIVDFLGGIDELDGVFSSSEYYVATASEVAARLGLRTANTDAIRLCRDKGRLGEVLAQRGIVVPRAQDLPLLDLATTPLDALGFPVVVKPRTGSGSVDVKLLANAEQVRRHCEHMRQEGQLWALMQSYVEGAEYSVETLTANGSTRVLAVIRKHLGAEPYFVETGHSFPAGLSATDRQRVEATVVAALDAVGFAFGPAHTELRVTAQAVTIIEINPRLAGGMIPLLLKEVLDFDVIDHVLGMWTTTLGLPDPAARRYGAIRFALPAREGVLVRPVELPADIRALPEVRSVHVMRLPGDHVRLARDFRDRVAAIVCAGDHRDIVEATAERAAAAVVIDLAEPAAPAPQAGAATLPAHLQRIVYRSAPDTSRAEAEMQCLLDINEAHLIMLGATGIVERDIVRGLVEAHRSLRATGCAAMQGGGQPRGLYMQLEQHLIDTLGERVGGALQTGRSRNDINAATTKLMLRRCAAQVFGALWQLRRSLVFKASLEVGKAFPIYSQYQPALPGTLTHQLLAFEQGLAAECGALLAAFDEIDVCPLGAGAGGGSTLPIDADLACKLLGFERPAANSLDAVANRNAAVRFLSGMNAIALLMSRIAQDLQLWATAEFAFVHFPDALTGGSSMLPQKRNPYLAEFIKSRAGIALASLVGCAALVGKAPYTNSYEVGSQINGFVVDAHQAVADALAVAQALIDGIEVATERVEQHLRDSAVASLAVSEALAVRQGISFRSAHTQVASSLRRHVAAGGSGHQALVEMEHEFMARGPAGWAMSHAAGGGPGSAGLGQGVAHACASLAADGAAFSRREDIWQQARLLRSSTCEQLLGG